MERIYKGIKDFLTTTVNSKLNDFCDTEITTLPEFKDKFVIHGTVDLTKYQSKLVTSVLLEDQNEYEGTIVDFGYTTKVTITFICSGDTQDKLVSKVCRYASCFKSCLNASPTFNKKFVGSSFDNMKVYYDAGTTDKQMTAVEIELTILTNY